MYRTLGRSGLRVSQLALGTMTFGQADWGCDRDTAYALLDAYLDAGGTFIDTADRYGQGTSEELVGSYLEARNARDRVVLATKFSLAYEAGNANSAGNGRKAMIRALDATLRRLRTDYVDLYYMHAWDGFTPVEEVVASMGTLVDQGKVRYIALSDVPGWYAARAQTLAECRGSAPFCAAQMEYSLVERGVEYEFPALCRELGLGLVAWSPLGSGVLSGKYRAGVAGDGRLHTTGRHTPEELVKLTPRNFEIVSALQEVADELGRCPAQVAINWVANRPAVATVLLGARTVEQLNETLSSLDFDIPAELRARLDDASRPAREKPTASSPGSRAS